MAGTLELLDAGGAPRLRVAPPFIVGADGARTDATLAVEGCAVDTNPAAPWGRPVTAPGAASCTLRVSWPDEAVAYPAVLDPRWTTTGSMTTARQEHTATLLSTGKVLVAGGRADGSDGARLGGALRPDDGDLGRHGEHDGSPDGSHSATQLGTTANATTSGKVLIAGGINGTDQPEHGAALFAGAGTWVAATNLNAARHGHTATLLADGRVLVAGGLNGTATLAPPRSTTRPRARGPGRRRRVHPAAG